MLSMRGLLLFAISRRRVITGTGGELACHATLLDVVLKQRFDGMFIDLMRESEWTADGQVRARWSIIRCPRVVSTF
jgi:hypothetical protein